MRICFSIAAGAVSTALLVLLLGVLAPTPAAAPPTPAAPRPRLEARRTEPVLREEPVTAPTRPQPTPRGARRPAKRDTRIPEALPVASPTTPERRVFATTKQPEFPALPFGALSWGRASEATEPRANAEILVAPSEPPSAELAVGATDGVTRAAVGMRTPEPAYPSSARAAGEEGVVVVAFVVGADGVVADAKVESSDAPTSLRRAALETVRSWTFSPALDRGLAAPSTIRRRFVFKLTDG